MHERVSTHMYPCHPFLETDPHVVQIAFFFAASRTGYLHYRMQALTDVPKVLEQAGCVQCLL